MSWLQKVGQRKLVQWGFAYLAGAWLALQVIDVLAETFGWPAAVERSATMVLGVGLLAALILAWYHGEQGRQRVGGVELIMLAAVLMLAAGAVWWSRTQPRNASPLSAAEIPGVSVDSTFIANSIAVLPFASLSDDRSDAYFADGIHEDILTQLSRVRDLSVTSRTSVLGYRDGARDIRKIARELGVASILEGTVRRDGGRIRFTAQLIDARSDRHRWAEVYDRELTDVFAIQAELAQAVVAALEAHLTDDERAAIALSPTGDIAAYDLYLQARDYHQRTGWRAENMFAAERLYTRAIELDSTFALAHARLSHLHSGLYWWSHDRTPERLRKAKAALDAARRFHEHLPDVHVAAAYYHYWGSRDYDKALQELAEAQRLSPGDTEVRRLIAYIQRRQGKREEALKILESLARIDPRNADLFMNLAVSYSGLARVHDAIRVYDYVYSLAPDNHLALIMKAAQFLRLTGRTDSLRAALSRVPRDYEPTTLFPRPVRYTVAMFDRDYDEALRVLGSPQTEAAELLREYRPRTMLAAFVYQAQGDTMRARANFDSALVVLKAVARERPDEPAVHSALGMVYAGLGRKAEAVREARRATELLPISSDAMNGRYFRINLAGVYAQIGEADAAIRELQSVGAEGDFVLRHERRWDPLRNHPDFRRLLGQ